MNLLPKFTEEIHSELQVPIKVHAIESLMVELSSPIKPADDSFLTENSGMPVVNDFDSSRSLDRFEIAERIEMSEIKMDRPFRQTI